MSCQLPTNWLLLINSLASFLHPQNYPLFPPRESNQNIAAQSTSKWDVRGGGGVFPFFIFENPRRFNFHYIIQKDAFNLAYRLFIEKD